MKTIQHQLSADDIKQVADAAHGYVGADLAAVCKEGECIFNTRNKHEYHICCNNRRMSNKCLGQFFNQISNKVTEFPMLSAFTCYCEEEILLHSENFQYWHCKTESKIK